jgi:SpoVK/Ycf46/Vps4 family AAA+-type ATPase
MTEGYSGSDLRLVIREAVLNALLEDRKKLDQGDLERSVGEFRRRISDYKRSIAA